MQREPDRLEAGRFDLLVVGGGITGAGIARDAALRGLATALVERRDFGDGTSSRSSRLIHGGLRYLEQFRFGLVRESLRERATLIRIAPHLVRPLRFLIPVYQGAARGPLQLRIGLFLYDHLARRGPFRAHEMIEPDEVSEMEPGLRREGLRAGALYPDAWVDDRRLVVANVLAAARAGAIVANHVEVTEIEPGFEVSAVDRLADRPIRIRARHVVNAAGPLADEVVDRSGIDRPPLLRLSRGAHLVFPRDGGDHALLLVSPVDGRVVFVIPEDELTVVGTTEVEVDRPPDEVFASAEEIDYLLATLRGALPGRDLTRERLLYTYAGLRPLFDESEDTGAGDLSREAEVRADEVDGGEIVSVYGGKITSYRSLAQTVVDRFSQEPCPTHRESLPGGEGIDDVATFRRIETARARRVAGLGDASARHLVERYGSEWRRVVEAAGGDASLLATLGSGRREIAAEVLHAARHEMALSVTDVILGRLTLGRSPRLGLDEAERVAALLRTELDWTEERTRDEVRRFRETVRRRHGVS